MNRDDVVVLVWALFLVALGTTAVAIFDVRDPHTPSLFGGAALLMLLIGAYLFARRRRTPDAGDRSARVIPDTSLPTVWVAVSVAALAVGAQLGLWLVLIAAGALVVGLGGLVRESRASREMTERALAPDRAGIEEPPGAGEGRGPRLRVPGEG